MGMGGAKTFEKVGGGRAKHTKLIAKRQHKKLRGKTKHMSGKAHVAVCPTVFCVAFCPAENICLGLP